MDDIAREGRITRNLFRTASESSESDDEGDAPQERQELLLQDSDGTGGSTVVRRVLHVELEERTVGGSIEQRLWPAAEYLATFVLNLASGKAASLTALAEAAGVASVTTSDTPGRSAALQATQNILRRGDDNQQNAANAAASLKVMELGAGVGLTGLEVASQLDVQVLLTDLEVALLLLRSNLKRNARVTSKVQVQKLEWGNDSDIADSLVWYRGSSSAHPDCPLLILGSDCVYWECLYEPLRSTIATLLQSAAPGSLCLLAGMRRWKRDNRFYQRVLGKSNAAGHLECTCIDEQVQRVATACGTDERQVMRIYAVQWVAK